MGMVFCRGCGKEIHETAPTCPHCGFVQGSIQNNGIAVGNISNMVNEVHPESNNPFTWFAVVMKKYATFGGRSRRKEYWYSVLAVWLISFLIGFCLGILNVNSNIFQAVNGLFSLAVLLPSIAVGVRRMHDTNRSGWWLLLPLVNIVFLAQDSTIGSNQYGSNPKGK